MSNERIVLMARLKVKPDMVEPAREAALAIVAPSRAEPGCINYDVHQAVDDPTVFLWHETWADKAALDAHFAQPFFADFFAKAQQVMAEEPQIILSRMISEK